MVRIAAFLSGRIWLRLKWSMRLWLFVLRAIALRELDITRRLITARADLPAQEKTHVPNFLSVSDALSSLLCLAFSLH